MSLSSSAWIRILVAVAAALIASLPTAAPAQVPERLTVYSSLPHAGDLRAEADDVVRGARLALEEAGGQAAGRPIRFVKRNSATAVSGSWDPARTSANARRAAMDESTIAYLGELDSGATAISMPILNEARIAQVSPANTYVGLTRRHPLGSRLGEPDKYHPSGERNYARIIPADHAQAAALATYVRELGARRVALVDDGEVYGRSLGLMVRAQLRRKGAVVARHATLRGPGRAAAVAHALRGVRADALIFTGITSNGAVPLWRAVHRAHPRWALLGADGVADRAFTRRIPRSAARRTHITMPTLDLSGYAAAARDFDARFRARYGTGPESYAIYGYEAMALILDAIGRATDPTDREAVIRALFATRDRESVLGRYSIDSFGDTTLGVYGAYRVTPDGRMAWNRVIRVAR